jgi:hypothetical protein
MVCEAAVAGIRCRLRSLTYQNPGVLTFENELDRR